MWQLSLIVAKTTPYFKGNRVYLLFQLPLSVIDTSG